MTTATVTVGQPVPDFHVQSTGGKTVGLGDFAGQWLVLYFYPKDHTPVCTQQGLAFADHYPEFVANNAVIAGVSRDAINTHESFKARQRFPFELWSDPDETLCRLFGVLAVKSMFGKQFKGIERSTFLIAPNGVLAHEWRKVKVKGHSADVLATLKARAATD